MHQINVGRFRGLLPLVLAAAPACSAASGSCEVEIVREAKQALHFAQPEPGVVALTPAQKSAIVSVVPRLGPAGFFCSGAVVAPGWILTAAHCNLGGGLIVGVGSSLKEPAASWLTTEITSHPSLDVLLARIPLLASAQDVSPMPVASEKVGPEWLGSIVQLCGFGERADKSFGVLEFLAAEVASVSDESLVVEGHGRAGACRGDSGSPLLIQGRDGAPQVAGVLSSGSSSCVDTDRFTRSDVFADWAAEIIGPPVSTSSACGNVSTEGACQRGTAIWCDEQGSVQSEACGPRRVCGWAVGSGGFRCVQPEEDACRGMDQYGVCEGERAVSCQGGVLLEADCDTCDQRCVRNTSSGKAQCEAR